MSTSTEGLLIPDWDLADRLNKALKVAGMSVQEMADYLGVHRNTVSAWINDRTPPDTRTIRLWAMRTGVPFEWLRDGTEPSGPPPDPHQLGGSGGDPQYGARSKRSRRTQKPVDQLVAAYKPADVAA